MKVKFSIRYKILSVMTALLIAAICFYLLLAMRIFKQDKTELVFDLNKGLVSTLSAEVETSLRGASDKLKLYALLSQGEANKKAQHIFQDILENDALLVQIELYERTSAGELSLVSKVTDNGFLKLYNIDENYFSKALPEKRPIPFEAIQSSSMGVWNASSEGSPPLLGLGISVIKEGAKGVPEKMMAVVGYIKADLFLKNLRSSTLTQVFVVDSGGKILLHTKNDLMNNAADYSKYPIVSALTENKVTNGVLEFSYKDKNYLGAFSKTGFSGVSVVSQVESEQAFLAVSHLVRRSLIFALMVSTITFIATIFFSRTLTKPLNSLLMAMEKVSEGDLDAVLKVKSHDEISILSNSFNRMTSDLKSSRVQLEEINRELENKVIDRTKKLEEQNRAVKEAQEALLRTTRLASVGEIAGRTAHEVLNPLTSIMARVQRVQKRLGDEISSDKNLLGEILKAWKGEFEEKGFEGFLKSLKEPSQINPGMTLLQEDLNNIGTIFNRWDEGLNTLSSDTQFLLQQAGRIEKILTSMRSLSHVGGQRQQFKGHEILHDAVNIVADLFAKNKIQLVEGYKAAENDIFVDRDELIQVLTNILKNSLQAVLENKSPKSKVYVETSCLDNKLVIDIVDNGIGIAPENLSKLFENHFSTKSPDLGTGLGLSISRRFVRAFNGDLFLVKSEPGVETRFRIELPLHSKVQEAAA